MAEPIRKTAEFGSTPDRQIDEELKGQTLENAESLEPQVDLGTGAQVEQPTTEDAAPETDVTAPTEQSIESVLDQPVNVPDAPSSSSEDNIRKELYDDNDIDASNSKSAHDLLNNILGG